MLYGKEHDISYVMFANEVEQYVECRGGSQLLCFGEKSDVGNDDEERKRKEEEEMQRKRMCH